MRNIDLVRDDLRFVSTIYDAVLSPERWPEILDMLCLTTSARGATLQVLDEQYTQHECNIVSSLFRDTPNGMEYLRFYAEHLYKQEEAAYRYVRDNPGKGFMAEYKCLGFSNSDILESHPPTQYLYEKFGIYYRYACRLNTINAWQDQLSIQTSKTQGVMSHDELQHANQFIPHFAKSVEMGRIFSVLKSRFDAIISALDHYKIGTIILTTTGQIVTINEEAKRILEAKDGISIGPKRSIYMTGKNKLLLDKWIQKVGMTAIGENMDSEGQILVKRPSRKDPYLITICPLKDEDGNIESKFRGAICYMLDPDFATRINTSGIARLFGLTAAESDVCSLIASGFSTEAISEIRSTRIETVRSQIKQIMSKTNVNSRTALVALATKIDLPIV